LGMSLKPIWSTIKARFKPTGPQAEMEAEHLETHAEPLPVISDCGPDCDCSSGKGRSWTHPRSGGVRCQHRQSWNPSKTNPDTWHL